MDSDNLVEGWPLYFGRGRNQILAREKGQNGPRDLEQLSNVSLILLPENILQLPTTLCPTQGSDRCTDSFKLPQQNRHTHAERASGSDRATQNGITRTWRTSGIFLSKSSWLLQILGWPPAGWAPHSLGVPWGGRIALTADETIPAVSPLGYPARKQSLTERVTRVSIGAVKRKPWQEMFFLEKWENPMKKVQSGFMSPL